MPGVRSPLFIAILVAYLAAGVLYAALTPSWQAPDEPAHYNYVRYLAQEPGLPELVPACYNQAYLDILTSHRFSAELSIDSVCYEFYQPPLYYLLATPVFMIGQGSLLALRLFSVVLGGVVVALAFFIGRTIFPDKPATAYGAMAFVAFMPMHAAIVASVNNDVLVELIIALLLLLLVRRLLWLDPPTLQSDAWLGMLLALGLLTKLTVYVLALPLIAVALWWTRAGGGWWAWARRPMLIYGLALIVALPWYIRNAVLYGNFDILGLARHNAVVVGQPRTADLLASVGTGAYLADLITTTFHSFWGQFGWMAAPMDGRTYLALFLLTVMALAGLIPYLLRATSPAAGLPVEQRRALSLLALAVGLMILAYLGYNVRLVQFQGRYLFPALIPIGLFFSLGLGEVFDRRWRWWLAGGLVLVLVWLVFSAFVYGDLDKRTVLAIGLLLALAAGRAWLERRRPIPATWLLAACYLALAWLTLASPFWFVAPNLSP